VQARTEALDDLVEQDGGVLHAPREPAHGHDIPTDVRRHPLPP